MDGSPLPLLFVPLDYSTMLYRGRWQWHPPAKGRGRRRRVLPLWDSMGLHSSYRANEFCRSDPPPPFLSVYGWLTVAAGTSSSSSSLVLLGADPFHRCKLTDRFNAVRPKSLVLSHQKRKAPPHYTILLPVALFPPPSLTMTAPLPPSFSFT